MTGTGWTYVNCTGCGRRIRSRLSGERTRCTECGGRPYVPVGAVRDRVWLTCHGAKGCGHVWSSTAAERNVVKCPECRNPTRVPVNARAAQRAAAAELGDVERLAAAQRRRERLPAPRPEPAPPRRAQPAASSPQRPPRARRASRARRLHGWAVNPQRAPGPWVVCVMARRAGPEVDDWTWCTSPAFAAYVPSDAETQPEPVYVARLDVPGTFPICEGCAPVLTRARHHEPNPGVPIPRRQAARRPPSWPAEPLDVEPVSPIALGGTLGGMIAGALLRRRQRAD